MSHQRTGGRRYWRVVLAVALASVGSGLMAGPASALGPPPLPTPIEGTGIDSPPPAPGPDVCNGTKWVHNCPLPTA